MQCHQHAPEGFIHIAIASCSKRTNQFVQLTRASGLHSKMCSLSLIIIDVSGNPFCCGKVRVVRV